MLRARPFRPRMRILFDNGTPSQLRHALKEHLVVKAATLGWSSLSNGLLLAEAEAKVEILGS